MKNLIKLSIILLLVFIYSFGAHKSRQDARNIAATWFQSNTLAKAVKKTVDRTETKNFQGREVFHIINLKPTGFIIVSADDNARPVLAYSETQTFDTETDHPGIKAFLDQYARYVYHSSQVPNPVNNELWQNISEASAISDTIDPLINTLWDQNWPYNKFAPVDSTAGSYNNYRTYAGCVATTMSQIMKYYNYPAVGLDSSSYNHPDYGTLSAHYDSTVYEWDKMKRVIFSHSPDADIDPIARLMYHCGISVEMGYGPEGSGAFSQQVPDAMNKFFDYSSEIHLYSRNSFSDQSWEKLLIAELYDGRPIYYAGDDQESGHAFVCDGYRNRQALGNYFHFNWGWSGSGNGYYTINDMTFNYGQDIIVNIAPRGQIAKFTADINRGVPPLTVNFTDQTEDDIISWEWDFDADGTIDSYEQSPTWTYTEPGDYTVTLRVSNDSIAYQKTRIDLIEAVSENEIYGTILTDRTLEAGQIKVLNNVTIPENVTLTIMPGVVMEFQGNYELKVDGNIIAEGNVYDPIIFTAADTAGFADLNGNSGGWKGIYLTGKANDTTRFNHCKFEYVKKSNALRSINNNNVFLSNCTFTNNIGSALGIWFNNEKRIKIDKCLFKNNVNHGTGNYANWGTAIVGFLAHLDITNSIFTGNKMKNTGAISLASTSSINLVNCTVTDNISDDMTTATIDISMNSRLHLQNTILWNEDVDEINFQGDNIAWISHNNLQSGLAEIVGDAPEFLEYKSNINADPQFADDAYNLANWSQCIDRGTMPGDSLIIDSLDYKQEFRLYSTALDLGAMEFPGEPARFNVGFTADIDSGEFPLTVTFTDTTKTDDIIAVKWDFENDGTWDAENEFELAYTYENPGIYSVSMLALRPDSTPVFVLHDDLIQVTGTETGLADHQKSLPGNYYLEQNYPNPFNPSTTIRYGIPVAAKVNLAIYNILGQKVTTLVNSTKSAGHYSVAWNGLNDEGKILPSGIYIYKLQSSSFSTDKKMFFIK